MFWKFYWGESPDDPNSFNAKKMKFCLADATKDYHLEFKKEPTDFEAELTKPRKSSESVRKFIDRVSQYPTEPLKE